MKTFLALLVFIVAQLLACAIVLVAQPRPQFPAGVISGQVVDTSGAAIVGATVRVQGTRSGGLAKGDGCFLIAGVRPGTYTVEIGGLGHRPEQRTVAVIAMAETNLGTVELASNGDSIITCDLVCGGRMWIDRGAFVARTIDSRWLNDGRADGYGFKTLY